MALYNGDSTRIAWFKESGTYATISGVASWLGQTTEATQDETQNTFQQRYIGGGTRNVDRFVPGPTDNRIRLSYLPQDWRMLVYTWGTVTNATVSGTERHIVGELNSTGTYPSFAVELSKVGVSTNKSTTFRGCVVDSIEVAGNMGEPFTVNLDLIAQGASGGTGVATPTSGTITPMLWSDGKGLNVSGTAFGLTGYLTELKSVNIRLRNNLDAPHYIRESRDISKPIPGNREYELEATVNMTESTGANFTNTFRNGSSLNYDFFITRLGSDFTATGTDGTKNFVQFWASGAVITDHSEQFVAEGVTEQTFTIRGQNGGAIVGDAFPAGSWNTFA